MMDKYISVPNPLFLRNEELIVGLDLLFYAYKSLIKHTKPILDQYGYGQAHYRVLYLIGRFPEININELLDILEITKQSLGRLMRQLLQDGFIEQVVGKDDRRQRHNKLSPAGHTLLDSLLVPQQECVAQVYQEVGARAVDGYRGVLTGLLDKKFNKYLNKVI